jgi:short-chain fatty acids transporter
MAKVAFVFEVEQLLAFLLRFPVWRLFADHDNGWLPTLGLRLSTWFERWFPGAFALALAALAVVFGASVALGSSPLQSAQWFGADRVSAG